MPEKRSRSRRYFLAGFLTLLPVVLTLYLFRILISFIGGFSSPFLKPTFKRFFGPDYSQLFLDITSFLLVLAFIWMVGFIVGNLLLGKRLVVLLEKLLIKIPIISSIYSTFKKATEFISPAGQKKFQRVVLAPFPKSGSYALGFMTAEGTGEVQDKTKSYVLNIFIPTTPNPTSGFLIFVPKEEVIPLSMSVDDAIKLIISGGIIVPKFEPEKEKIKQMMG